MYVCMLLVYALKLSRDYIHVHVLLSIFTSNRSYERKTCAYMCKYEKIMLYIRKRRYVYFNNICPTFHLSLMATLMAAKSQIDHLKFSAKFSSLSTYKKLIYGLLRQLI